MAVIQPYFIPDISRGSSAFAIGWNTFLQERTKMNYKMMDMHLKKADPTYLFKQMEVIDNNIIEYQKMKNDLIKARGSGGSEQALRIAQARAKDAVFNAKAKQDANKPRKLTSEQENLKKLGEELDKNVTIGAIQSVIKEDQIYDARLEGGLPELVINNIISKTASEHQIKNKTDPEVKILLNNEIIRAIKNIDDSQKNMMFDVMDADGKATQQKQSVTDVLDEVERMLLQRSGVFDQRELQAKVDGIKLSLAEEATGLQVITPEIVDTAEFFKGLGGPSYAGRIKELNKLIEGERQRKAQLGTQAELQMRQLQEMSPFEPFQRNYVRETAFQSRPSQRARQDLISQQLAKSVKGTSSYPGLEFNKPYETAGGMMVGVTQVGGQQRPFSIIGGREDIYSPGETGYNEIDRLLKQLSMVQQEQAQMVK